MKIPATMETRTEHISITILSTVQEEKHIFLHPHGLGTVTPGLPRIQLGHIGGGRHLSPPTRPGYEATLHYDHIVLWEDFISFTVCIATSAQ